MRVLLIGSGGREHALALKISRSKSLTHLYCIPGNPGTESLGSNISLSTDNHSLIIKFCKENLVDLVLVGPEQPLVDGIS